MKSVQVLGVDQCFGSRRGSSTDATPVSEKSPEERRGSVFMDSPLTRIDSKGALRFDSGKQTPVGNSDLAKVETPNADSSFDDEDLGLHSPTQSTEG